MELFLCILLLVVGFVVLIFGADWLVAGASSLAKQFGLSELAIGLTIVAFGTSMPELVVNVLSSYSGANDMAFGNIIGSNLFNTLAILGVAGVIYPLTAQSNTTWREIPFSLFCAVLLFVLANDALLWGSSWSGLGRIDAGILLVFFIGFLYYAFYSLKKEPQPADDDEEEIKILPAWKTYGLIFLGLGGLVGGGHLVVENAKAIAAMAGMSDRLIGLTIVAAGTSLPELATSAVAAFRKKSDIAIGNVVGSNIFNVLFILTAGSFILPTEYNPKMNFDLLLFMGVTVLFFLFLLIGKKHQLQRWQAALLLAIFLGYMVFLVVTDQG